MFIEVVNCYMCEIKVWILVNGFYVLFICIYSLDGLFYLFDYELIEKFYVLFYIRFKNRFFSSYG